MTPDQALALGRRAVGCESVEIWRPIHDADGYEISDLGRARSWIAAGGPWGRNMANEPRILRQSLDGKGYPTVNLPNGPGAWRVRRICRVVLLAFVGAPPSAYECAHLNGDRNDSRLVNLAWTTRSENHSHKRKHGTDHQGERAPAARLTNAQAATILVRIRAGETPANLAREFGVSDSTVSRIKLGRSYQEAEALVALLEAAHGH